MSYLFKIKLKYVALTFATILTTTTVFSQSWLSTPFKIDGSPRTLFWDSTSGWFYVAGNIYEVNGEKVHRMFRFNNSGVLDYMDTVNYNLEAILSIVKYRDTVFHFGYPGMSTYFSSKWQHKLYDPVFYKGYVYKDEILIGGYFKDAISSNDGVVIRYKNGQFYPFLDAKNRLGGPTGESGSVGAFAEYKGKLYLGGNFSFDTINDYYEIVAWDSSGCDNMNGGIPGSSGFENISDLIVYKDELYVGGKFYSSTGSQSNHILKWDGDNWYTLGDGLYGQGIADMVIYKDELWVIGAIDSVKGLPLGNVAIWNGSNWCDPGGKFDFMPFYGAVFGDTLYVGGNFDYIDNNYNLAYLVKYNPNAPRTCGDPAEIKPVGVRELPNKNNDQTIELFPNPSSGEINIQLDGKFEGDIMLYNLSGRLVYQMHTQFENRVALSLPRHIDNGLYLIRLSDSSRSYSSKILLKR